MIAKSVTENLYPPLPVLLWLSIALSLVVLPHIFRLTSWIFPLFFSLLIWRYVGFYKPRLLPKSIILFIIAGCILVGILLTYRTLFGRDAGISLLIALCGLKIMEADSRRDVMLICFLGYFLVMTTFLHSQTIPKTLYMGSAIILLTTTLITITDSHQHLSVKERLKLASVLFIQAFPLMIVLFILFPRVPGPFWSLPKDAHQALTGLSDNITLGDVSELSLSDEIAFRVKFDGEIPAYSQRYWRGPLLWQTNGRKWKSGYESKALRELPFQPLGKPVKYTVTLEPHQKRWLLALDLPAKVSHSLGHLTKDYQVLSKTPIYQRTRYTLTSYTEYKALSFNPWQRQLALSLPATLYPRTRALALQWKQENAKPAYLIRRALQHFSQPIFTYSYTPPFLANQRDPLDFFMFETQQGFCEHYAVAFTVLMRAAGVPTRIVTGYLGGSVNPYDEYMTIRQRDAHAWVEVWLEHKGWVRIDPTAVVAPERLNRSVEEVLAFENNAEQLTEDSIWQQLRYGWDAFDNVWNQWILNYDQERQKRLFDYFGFNMDWRGLTIALVIILSSLLTGLSIWLVMRSAGEKPERVQRLYTQFCKKLARQGLSRQPSEGPLQYASRIEQARPELATFVQQITTLYVQIRYRSQMDNLAEFALTVRRFRP
jgi:transglutaminase-like putative cysteine protease